MLVDAGTDVAVINGFSRTALDVALHKACNDFIEVFAADQSTFNRATRTCRTAEFVAMMQSGFDRAYRPRWR